MRIEACKAIALGVKEFTVELPEDTEDRFYRVSDPGLVRDVLEFLSKACQRDRGGFAKVNEDGGMLDILEPEPMSFNVYPEDDLIGPGWSKLWNRILKEGKRISPAKEDE